MAVESLEKVLAEDTVLPKDSPPLQDAALDLQFLEAEGYVVVRGAVEQDVCEALRAHVLAMTDEGAAQGRSDLFGNVQETENRYDLKLDLCAPVVQALNQFMGRCGPMLTGFMGPNVKVVELAAITSDPGAKAQPVHADTMHGVTRFLQSEIDLPSGPQASEDASDDEDIGEDLGQIVKAVATETAIITSALIALQDVEASMGPTHVWPRTNTVEHHATLWGTSVGGKLSVTEADEAFKVDHLKMTIKKGDLVLYDSRLMHCGGANTSLDQRRTVLVVSTMGLGIRPDGTTWSMLKSLRNRLRLKDFPLSPSAVTAPTATPGCVVLPEKPQQSDACAVGDDVVAGKEIPPLDEWQSAVQCALCRQWRPVSVEEAPRFASAEKGFFCKAAGFSCSQPQKYTQKEIDDALA